MNYMDIGDENTRIELREAASGGCQNLVRSSDLNESDSRNTLLAILAFCGCAGVIGVRTRRGVRAMAPLGLLTTGVDAVASGSSSCSAVSAHSGVLVNAYLTSSQQSWTISLKFCTRCFDSGDSLYSSICSLEYCTHPYSSAVSALR